MVPTEEQKKIDEKELSWSRQESHKRTNRAERRQKPKKLRYNIFDYIIVPSNILTSPSHKYNQIRKKNAPTKQQRIRAAAQARKDHRASNSQVS